MQLNALFSFLGMNASSEGDVKSDAGAKSDAGVARKSSGFGAMLSSTLALLSQKGGRDAATQSILLGETGNPQAAATQSTLGGLFATSDNEIATVGADILNIDPKSGNEPEAEAESFWFPIEQMTSQMASDRTGTDPQLTPSTETGVGVISRNAAQDGETTAVAEDFLKSSAGTGSVNPNDDMSEERLARIERSQEEAGVQTQTRPDGTAEQAIETSDVDGKIQLETPSETLPANGTSGAESSDAGYRNGLSDAPLPSDADLIQKFETTPANDNAEGKRRGGAPAGDVPPPPSSNDEAPAVGNRPLQDAEPDVTSSDGMQNAKANEATTPQRDDASDVVLRPNTIEDGDTTTDTATSRSGTREKTPIAMGTPPSTDPSPGDSASSTPPKFEERVDGSRASVDVRESDPNANPDNDAAPAVGNRPLQEAEPGVSSTRPMDNAEASEPTAPQRNDTSDDVLRPNTIDVGDAAADTATGRTGDGENARTGTGEKIPITTGTPPSTEPSLSDSASPTPSKFEQRVDGSPPSADVRESEPNVTSSRPIVNPEAKEPTTSQRNDTSDDILRPNTVDVGDAADDTATSRTGKNTRTDTGETTPIATGTPPSTEPSLGDSASPTPSKYEQRVDGSPSSADVRESEPIPNSDHDAADVQRRERMPSGDVPPSPGLDDEAPAVGNRPLREAEPNVSSSRPPDNAEAKELTTPQRNDTSDDVLRPNTIDVGNVGDDTAGSRTGSGENTRTGTRENTRTGTGEKMPIATGTPPSTEPSLSDSASPTPSKFEERVDGSRAFVHRESAPSARQDSATEFEPRSTAATADRPTPAGAEHSEPRRVVDLERASHFPPADRIRIWQERSAGASSDPKAAQTTSKTDAADEVRISGPKHPPADVEAEVDGSAEKLGALPRTQADSKTVAAKTATPNTQDGRSPRSAELPADAAKAASSTRVSAEDAPAKTEGQRAHESVGTGPEADAGRQAAAFAARVEEPAEREPRTDGDRSSSRASSAETIEAGDAAKSETGEKNDFMARSEVQPDDAFDVAAEELIPDALEFEAALQDEAATLDVDVEPPVDIQSSESTEKLTFTPERGQSTTTTGSLAEPERIARPRQAGNLNWMRAMLEDSLEGLSLEDDWKVLEMKLDEGQGTMTVRARRDEEAVSITVNFSDPQLRALAAENSDRLQETLRAQYQTQVDFSLMNDNAGQSQQRRNETQRDGGRELGSITSTRTESVSGADRARATRAALIGARNEWVG